MINDFEDFCTWMYVIIDEIWQQIAPFFKALFTDSRGVVQVVPLTHAKQSHQHSTLPEVETGAEGKFFIWEFPDIHQEGGIFYVV